MAILNKNKKNALRKDPLYQCIIEDLVEYKCLDEATANEMLKSVSGFKPYPVQKKEEVA